MGEKATLQRFLAAVSNAPETASYAAGQVIAAKYRLEQVLGEGGMGAVWLARNLTLDSDVALKLIHRELATPEAAERLLREARAAARLDHAAIVQVFDFGETEQGDPFIVMEVVRGESLGSVLDRKGRIAALNAVQLLLPIAGALSEAHTRGIVHRDVKPDNIILVPTEKGTSNPKLVDFGIAKFGAQQEEARPATVPASARRVRSLTQAGTVMGSPGYMSPEQIKDGATVDHRADIWALCVSLYETVTGCLPFDDRNFNRLVCAILDDEPQPITDHGAGDERLWAIIRAGLEKDPAERWPSMRALGALLAQWLLDNGVSTDITGASLELHWMREGAPSLLSCPPPSGEPPPSRAATTEPVLRHVTTEPITAAPLEDPDAAPRTAEPRSSRTWIAVGAAGLLIGAALTASLLPRGAPAHAATFSGVVMSMSALVAPVPAPAMPRQASAPAAPAGAASAASPERSGAAPKPRDAPRSRSANLAPPSDPGF